MYNMHMYMCMHMLYMDRHMTCCTCYMLYMSHVTCTCHMYIHMHMYTMHCTCTCPMHALCMCTHLPLVLARLPHPQGRAQQHRAAKEEGHAAEAGGELDVRLGQHLLGDAVGADGDGAEREAPMERPEEQPRASQPLAHAPRECEGDGREREVQAQRGDDDDDPCRLPAVEDGRDGPPDEEALPDDIMPTPIGESVTYKHMHVYMADWQTGMYGICIACTCQTVLKKKSR